MEWMVMHRLNVQQTRATTTYVAKATAAAMKTGTMRVVHRVAALVLSIAGIPDAS